jgi:N-acyl-L-homoserine lactone synthetase
MVLNIKLDFQINSINELSEKDILDVFRLRYKIYSKEGLINTENKLLVKNNDFLKKLFSSNEDQLDINKLMIDCDRFDFLEKTKHILVRSNAKIIGYLRLIEDDKKDGLPLDNIYKNEHASLLNKDIKIAELSRYIISEEFRSMAINDGNRRNFDKQISYYLFRMMYAYIFKAGITDILIMTHPRHAFIYEKFYFFRKIGEEKIYAKVNNNSAVLLYQNIKETLDKSRYADPT